MKKLFSKETLSYKKPRRYRLPLALFIAMFGLCSDIGVRLGIWSAPGKHGLLPYEKPTFHAFRELFISDAFAS